MDEAISTDTHEARVRPAQAVGLDERRRQSWFYAAMWLAAVAVVFAGFGHSFYGVVTDSAPLSPLVHVHTAVFTAWLVLFIVQTRLVAARKVGLHMTVGYVGIGLAVLMIIVGYMTSIAGARRGFTLDSQIDSLAWMGFPLGNLLAFGVFVAVAYWYRRQPEVHRRLMLLATVGPLMTAPFAHLFAQLPERFNPQPPVYFLLLFIAFLFACAIYDRLSTGRFNKVSLWGAVAMFVYGNFLAAVVVPSAAWHRFAGWLVYGS